MKLYNELHEDLLWDMLDDGLLEALDALKKRFPKGQMLCNTWLWGGDRGWSGIRTKGSQYYSEGSMHSVGKAFDCIFTEYTTKEVRQYILDNRNEFPGITRVEGKVGWVHIDCKFTGKDAVYVFHT